MLFEAEWFVMIRDEEVSHLEECHHEIFFGLSLIKKVIYYNEWHYMMFRIILVSCITINIDDTLSDPLNAYKIYGHGYFVFFTRKSSFRLLEILERASRGILVVGRRRYSKCNKQT